MYKIYKNYLQEDVAEYLHTKIMNTPGDWWFHAHRFNNRPNAKYLNQTLHDQVIKEKIQSEFKDSFASGKYTYRFRRSLLHKKGCACYECAFRENFLNSNKFLSFIEKETGLKNPYILEQFISVYSPGDFLTTHIDQKRGVAFIFNLSKDWRAEYGGLLHIHNSDGTMTAINPEFNSLVLLELNNIGIPHFVSEVSSLAPRPRLAISGWYNSSDT